MGKSGGRFGGAFDYLQDKKYDLYGQQYNQPYIKAMIAMKAGYINLARELFKDAIEPFHKKVRPTYLIKKGDIVILSRPFENGIHAGYVSKLLPHMM